MYKIPLFDLNFDKKEEQAVLEVLRSKWISTGHKTAEFEEIFGNMFKAKHAVALLNCTIALHLALKFVGVEKDDEVICPSLPFVAAVNSIRYVNAVPNKRNKIRNLLAEQGMQTNVHYPPVNRFSIYKENYANLPLIEYAAENLFTFPIYSKLELAQGPFISNKMIESLNA